MPASLIRQDAGNGSDQKEDNDLGVLVHGVLWHVVPGVEDVGNVAKGRNGGRHQAASPAEVDRGIDDRQIPKALKQFVPEDQRGRRQIVQGTGCRDAERHHENAHNCLFVFHLSLIRRRLSGS